MERVQFQQEQMLAELKDLVEKKLFTQTETKQILKKRTQFETALVRRVAKKADYLRYAAYEMGLEQLRRKRVQRLKLEGIPPSLSSYALVRRQFHIFERALKKFKSDVGLWIQYIDIAKKEGAGALVGRICARALTLHPNTPSLYILAASHELAAGAPGAARTLLQRGVRLNAESVELWREWVRLELRYVENVRRRWDVLGISVEDKGKGKGKEAQDGEIEEEEELGEAARKQIMQGAIVKSVMSSAVQGIANKELFAALAGVIYDSDYPADLRARLVEHMDDLLRARNEGWAVRMLAERCLNVGSETSDTVEGVRKANEVFVKSLTQGDEPREDVCQAYVGFVEQLCSAERGLDGDLKLYLVSSMRYVMQGLEKKEKSSRCSEVLKAGLMMGQEGLMH